MVNLNHKYALALLEYAQEHGIEKMYSCVRRILSGESNDDEAVGDALVEFLKFVPPGQTEKVLEEFLSYARGAMNRVQVLVYSVVPLSQKQVDEISVRIAQNTGQQPEITQILDPSLLGGLRIVVGNTMVDDTLRRKLQDMKQSITEEVRRRNEL